MKKTLCALAIFMSSIGQSFADPMNLLPIEVEEQILSGMIDYPVMANIKNNLKCENFYESDIYNKSDNRIMRCGDKSHDLYIEIESKPLQGEILQAKILWQEKENSHNKEAMKILASRYAAVFAEFLPVRDPLAFVDNLIYNPKSTKRYNNGFFITTKIQKKPGYLLRSSHVRVRKR